MSQKKLPVSEPEILADAVQRLSRTVVVVALVALVAVLVAVGSFFLQTHKYFAVTNDGRLIPIQPLDQPIYSRQHITSFGVEALERSFSLDFVNYRSTLSEVRRYYTAEGYDTLNREIENSGLLARIQKEKLVSELVHTKAPVVVAEGKDIDGKFKWKVEFPVTFSLQGRDRVVPVSATAILVVERVDLKENTDGIGVSSVVLKVS